MPTKLLGSKRTKAPSATRASVTFPSDLYEALEEITRLKKVSVAWVVRDAAERYIAQERRQVSRAHKS